MCVFVGETWIGGAHSSYHMKGPREVYLLGYDALASDDIGILFYLSAKDM